MADLPPPPVPEENGAAPSSAGGPVGSAAVPRVRVRHLNHFFGTGETRKQGLIDNSLTLLPGEIIIMTGPSGSGKTTLLTLIGALRTVQEGSVQVMGRELFGLSNRARMEVRRDIGFIFQAHNLFDSLTAFQNVRVVLDLNNHPPRALDQMATEMLTRLGLGNRIHYKPAALSGGQRQRVAIARALVNRPRLVLADEPTAALDKDAGREVVDLLKELAQNQGCTILLVTHDSRILDVADRIVNLIDGRIASEILVEETVTIIEFLMKCPVFDSTPAALTEIAQKMVKEHYTPGAAIIRQGDEGDKFYLIREGVVEVRREEGGVTTMRDTMAAGSFFGEAALISGKPRNASVLASGDVLVYSLKKADFLAALGASPSLNQQLREVFFQRQALPGVPRT